MGDADKRSGGGLADTGCLDYPIQPLADLTHQHGVVNRIWPVIHGLTLAQTALERK